MAHPLIERHQEGVMVEGDPWGGHTAWQRIARLEERSDTMLQNQRDLRSEFAKHVEWAEAEHKDLARAQRTNNRLLTGILVTLIAVLIQLLLGNWVARVLTTAAAQH